MTIKQKLREIDKQTQQCSGKTRSGENRQTNRQTVEVKKKNMHTSISKAYADEKWVKIYVTYTNN